VLEAGVANQGLGILASFSRRVSISCWNIDAEEAVLAHMAATVFPCVDDGRHERIDAALRSSEVALARFQIRAARESESTTDQALTTLLACAGLLVEAEVVEVVVSCLPTSLIWGSLLLFLHSFRLLALLLRKGWRHVADHDVEG
jgi:hypothetical protein